MKTPWYETSAGATLGLLQSGLWADCDLYTITAPNLTTTLRYAMGPVDVAVPGNATWPCGGVIIDPDKSQTAGHWKIGSGVDTWQIVMSPRAYDPATDTVAPDTIQGLPWLSALRAGVLDGADVQVDRAFFFGWPQPPATSANPVGVVTIFKGILTGLDVSRSSAAFTISSYLWLLGLQSPRNIFQAGCRHTLFDAGCTLTASSFAVTGTVGSGSTQNVINSSIGAPSGSATYAQGRIVFTTGANAGFQRGVKSWSGGALTLIAPFYFPVNTGDAFTAYPGCNKTTGVGGCGASGGFNNLANFGGQPFIPAATTAL